MNGYLNAFRSPHLIEDTCMPRAVQCCCLGVTEFALQHLMSKVREPIEKGIPEPTDV